MEATAAPNSVTMSQSDEVMRMEAVRIATRILADQPSPDEVLKLADQIVSFARNDPAGTEKSVADMTADERAVRKIEIRQREARLSKDPDELRELALKVREGTCRDTESCRILLDRVRLHFTRQYERAAENMQLLREAEEAFARGWPKVPYRVTESGSSRPDPWSSAPLWAHRQTGTAPAPVVSPADRQSP